jgi:hypothetical protein
MAPLPLRPFPPLVALAVLLACGVRCDADGASETGECPAGQRACGGACVDPLTSNFHCGDCGHSCAATEHCEAGSCVPGASCQDECAQSGARECSGDGWRECGEHDGVDVCLEWGPVEACDAGLVCDPSTVTCREACGDYCDPFSVVLLPDTQGYTNKQNNLPDEDKTYFKQMHWILDHRASDNIQFVIHLGDITNDNVDAQWDIADRAHALLDAADMPYSMVPGNHDYRVDGVFKRDGSQFDQYFGVDRFALKPWFGGSIGASNTNNYTLFEVGPMRFMVVSLEYAPRKDVVCAAEDLIAANPDRRVIIATHCYLTHGGDYDSGCPDPDYHTLGSTGAALRDELVSRHSNIFLVVNGHVTESEHTELVRPTFAPVEEMVVDYQFEGACDEADVSSCTDHCRNKDHSYTGNGWLRQLVFDPRAGTVSAKTISVEEGNDAIFPGGEPAFFCSELLQGGGGSLGHDWYTSDPHGADHEFQFDYDMTSSLSSEWDDGGRHAFLDRTINGTGAGDQLVPEVAMAPGGGFVAVWEDDSDDSDGAGNHDVFARGFEPGGCAGFAELRVNVDSAGDQRAPAMAMDGAGNFVVAWQDDTDDNGAYQIHARGFLAGGSERFPTMTVNSLDTGQQRAPAAAATADGHFVVAWEDDHESSGHAQIWMRGFAADGTQSFADRSVHADVAGERIAPAVGIDANGRFVVVWQDDSDGNGSYQIHGKGFAADGTDRLPLFTVNSQAQGQQRAPAITMAPSGAFVVAWEDDTNDDGQHVIKLRGFAADGTQSFADEVASVNPNGQHRAPALALLADATFVLVWQNDADGNGSYQIAARRFDATGAAWNGAPEWSVNRIASGQQLAPGIAAAGSSLVVVWQDDLDGNNAYQILGRGIDVP